MPFVSPSGHSISTPVPSAGNRLSFSVRALLISQCFQRLTRQ